MVSFQYGTVTGTFAWSMLTGNPADAVPITDAAFSFVPRAGVIRDPSSPLTILGLKVTGKTDTDGVLRDDEGNVGVRLLATDDPDLNPTGFTWLVTINVTGHPSISFDIVVPTGSTIDLTTVIPVPALPGVAYVEGPAGPEGPANVLSIGTVTTLAPGSPATADITGISPAQTLDLGIPEGTKGDPGDPGPANTLTAGTVTTLTPGSPATASVTGAAPNQTLLLGIPQGAKGDTGAPGSPTAYELRGTGFPEGVVTAPVGTYYTDTNATNGAIRWVKASGTGNTGWRIEDGDTGWRSVSNNPTVLTTGALLIRRVNSTVYLTLGTTPYGVFKVSANGGLTQLPFPSNVGFRPMWEQYAEIRTDSATKAIVGNIEWDNSQSVIRVFVSNLASAQFGANLTGVSTFWPTNDPWPTTLPGTPA